MPEATSISQITTAHAIGAFQRELIKEGIDPNLVDHLVRDALSHILKECPFIVADEGDAQ